MVDVAMLGAHDAFSNNITLSSNIDPGEEESSLIRNKFLSSIGRGVMVRYTKAQNSSPKVLLSKGVRYFDVRLSFLNNSWVTKHSFISDNLSIYLDDIIGFLNDNPKEFIIFDIQHVSLEGSSYDDLFAFLESYKFEGKSLMDFVNYDSRVQPLGSLDVDQATGNNGGVVMFLEPDPNTTCGKHYERFQNVRSSWHNQISDSAMLDYINTEYGIKFQL